MLESIYGNLRKIVEKVAKFMLMRMILILLEFSVCVRATEPFIH